MHFDLHVTMVVRIIEKGWILGSFIAPELAETVNDSDPKHGCAETTFHSVCSYGGVDTQMHLFYERFDSDRSDIENALQIHTHNV